jgi:hypothetical protein
MSSSFGETELYTQGMPSPNSADFAAPSLRISVPLTDDELSALVSLSRDRHVSLATTMRAALREELSRAGVTLAGRETGP